MMSLATEIVLFTLGLFAAMLLLLSLGRWARAREVEQRPASQAAGPSAIDGALLGLLSLVLAFTFAAVETRFDWRRQLVVQETNAIGTAYLRVDLLPEAAQPALRDDFRRYVDARLAAYDKLPDLAAAMAEIDRAKDAQRTIWRDALAALRSPEAATSKIVVVQALNAMFDMQTTQLMAARLHPPMIHYGILVALALIASFVVGEVDIGTGFRWWFHAIAFSVLFSLTFFLVLELEFPRQGFIRIEDFDRALVELRQSMG